MDIEFVKILWNMVFSLVSMFVVSIITGIICDTFGELRGELDDALDFQETTCFVTYVCIWPDLWCHVYHNGAT
eukprot:SAG11_NODE_32_length_22830_cov_17.507941_22_plen_73_part_00